VEVQVEVFSPEDRKLEVSLVEINKEEVY